MQTLISILAVVENEYNGMLLDRKHAKHHSFFTNQLSPSHRSLFSCRSLLLRNSPCSDMYESISKDDTLHRQRQTLNKESGRLSFHTNVSEYKHLFETNESLVHLSSLSSWLFSEFSMVCSCMCRYVKELYVCAGSPTCN